MEFQQRLYELRKKAGLSQEGLADLLGEDGVVESAQYSARVEGDLLTVTLTAQCREEIGREQPGANPMESGAEETAPA